MRNDLDIQEIFLGKILENETLRIDSSFYEKTAYAYENFIKSKKHYFLPESSIVSGPFGSTLTSSSYRLEGIPFIRVSDINKGFRINKKDLIYISVADHARLSNSQLKIDDIVLSKVGNSIGFYARVDESLKVCNISENNIGIKLHTLNLSIERKSLILSYLNSKYGKCLTLRRSSGNAQPKLNVSDIAKIPIPDFTNSFERVIYQVLLKVESVLDKASFNYTEAKNLLMSEIGIDTDKIDAGAIQVKKLSDTYKQTGRLDAEYYQGKYDAITSFLNASSTIGSLCNLHYDNYVPSVDKYYKYIELANVGSSGELSGVETICGDDLPTRARRQVKKGQVVVSSIEGSLQSCALITDEFDNALCSTGFYVIDSDIINSETLLVLFKSAPIQSLLKQRCSGTILTAVSKSEFLNTPLCDIDDKIQNKIAEKVRDSFLLRKQAEDLLNLATTAVEVAIEEGEEAGLKVCEGADAITEE